LFKKLKESSYREFQRFLKKGLQSARAESVNPGRSKRLISRIQLAMGDECIMLLPIGKEIVWFDNEIWRYLDTPDLQLVKEHFWIDG